MDEIYGVPRNAGNILFAEDLVNYVLHRNTGVEIKPFRVETFRGFIHDRFNQTVRKAITYLDRRMSFIQDHMDTLKRKRYVINRDTFQKYAETVYRKYFPKEFNARLFLSYCALLAKMAAIFFNKGVLDAPTVAILNIIGTFEKVDMNTARWNIVNEMAERMAFVDRNYPNKLSLETAESCDVGEDENTKFANTQIPQIAEKFLFAEELVHHVMLRNSKVEILPWRVKRYQDKIKSRFVETTRQAIEFLCNKTDTNNGCVSTQDPSYFNTNTYKLKAQFVSFMHFPRGFELYNFLEYCVDIATSAAYFYNKGVPDTPTIAIFNIVKVISKYDMNDGRWNALNKIAEQYLTMDHVSQPERMTQSHALYGIVKGIVKQKGSPNKNVVVE